MPSNPPSDKSTTAGTTASASGKPGNELLPVTVGDRADVPSQTENMAPLPTDGEGAVSVQDAFSAGQGWMEDYLKLTRMTWNFYGSLLEEGGFQWTSWWFKWDPDERIAQQISGSIPPLSLAMRYSQSMLELGADLQGRWLDAWRSFYTLTPGALEKPESSQGETVH